MSQNEYANTARLLRCLGDALIEASHSLLDGDEKHAAECLRLVHDAVRAAEPARNWETLALLLEPYVARLAPPASADDSWPFTEHLDDVLDLETWEESPPTNLSLPPREEN